MAKILILNPGGFVLDIAATSFALDARSAILSDGSAYVRRPADTYQEIDAPVTRPQDFALGKYLWVDGALVPNPAFNAPPPRPPAFIAVRERAWFQSFFKTWRPKEIRRFMAVITGRADLFAALGLDGLTPEQQMDLATAFFYGWIADGTEERINLTSPTLQAMLYQLPDAVFDPDAGQTANQRRQQILAGQVRFPG